MNIFHGKTSDSRILLLRIALIGAFLIIVMRLFYLQILQHDHYVELANKEQVKKLIIPAKRGKIYALDHKQPVELVMNQEVYVVFADPTVIEEPLKVEKTVREIAGGNLVDGNLQGMLTDKSTQYKIIARDVSLRQAEMIKSKELKGVGFQKVSKRVYPEGSLAAQTLGFVNHEGKGQYGVESALNKRLIGTDGILKSVTDVANVPLSIGNENIHKAPVNGDNIVLTIDRNIQSKTEEALATGLQQAGATHGSVMVMDPNNGHVLAMANLPTYNPAQFTKVTDPSAFVNTTVSMPYEPGSVIKTLTVATGLDRGVIEPDSTFYNTDKIQVQDRTITNALKGITGNITIQSALNNSLNTGMVTIAQRLGDGNQITKGARDTIYSYFHDRFGLGEPTGIELAGEASGTVISPDDQQGNAVRYSNMVFGQGLDITMVQVCSAFSAIINGGTYHSPTVVAGTYNDGILKTEDNSKSKPNVLSPEASRKAREMIHTARTSYTSTDTPGYYTGGKTGTSQTIENGEYVSNQTIGTYLGFGGDDNSSKYVIMVQVSGKNMNLEGNKHAMPIFTDISNWMLTYLQIQPRK
jgi:cell division protein FtsI/penicillin-binding protein 2